MICFIIKSKRAVKSETYFHLFVSWVRYIQFLKDTNYLKIYVLSFYGFMVEKCFHAKVNYNIYGPFRLDNNHFRFMSPESSMPHTIVTYFYKLIKNHVTFSYVLHL